MDVQVERLVVEGETRNSSELNFQGSRSFVNKTQQELPTNWRNIEIEKIHEMGSADEQSKLVSSRNPANEFEPAQLSSQRTGKKDGSQMDINMVASFGNIENSNQVPKE